MKKRVIYRLMPSGVKHYVRVTEEYLHDSDIVTNDEISTEHTWELKIHSTTDVRAAQDFSDLSDQEIRDRLDLYALGHMFAEGSSVRVETRAEEVEVTKSYFVKGISDQHPDWPRLYTGRGERLKDSFASQIMQAINYQTRERAEEVLTALTTLNVEENTKISRFEILEGYYDQLEKEEEKAYWGPCGD